jgi:hypothetical protein
MWAGTWSLPLQPSPDHSAATRLQVKPHRPVPSISSPAGPLSLPGPSLSRPVLHSACWRLGHCCGPMQRLSLGTHSLTPWLSFSPSFLLWRRGISLYLLLLLPAQLCVQASSYFLLSPLRAGPSLTLWFWSL